MFPHFTHIQVGDDILGSTLNNQSAISLSIISAYWPTHGDTITAYNNDTKSHA